MEAKLKQITKDLVNEYIAKFNQTDEYSVTDQAITKLIGQFPRNDNREEILVKARIINLLYATRMFAIRKMAQHIHTIENIDADLKNGIPEVVDKIAKGHGIVRKKSKKEITFYSFASKYCSFHNPKAYPILDSNVKKMLWEYRKQSEFTNLSKVEIDGLKCYGNFKEIVENFRKHYRLEDFDFKQIDKFLWTYCQEWKKDSKK